MNAENTTETNEAVGSQGATLRYINRSAVKAHALHCANKLRPANKFSRVSQEFIDGVQAEVERLLKTLCAAAQPGNGADVLAPEGSAEKFVTGALAAKAESILNALAMRVIQQKVQRHPSTGVTLKN